MNIINITNQSRNKIYGIKREITEIMKTAIENLRLGKLYEINLKLLEMDIKIYKPLVDNLIDSYVKHTIHVVKKANYVLSTKIDNRYSLETWEQKYNLTKVINNIYYIQFDNDNCLFCEKVNYDLHFYPEHKKTFILVIKSLIANNNFVTTSIKDKVNKIIKESNKLCREIKENEESTIERYRQEIGKSNEKIKNIKVKQQVLQEKINELTQNLEIQELNLEKNQDVKHKFEKEILLKEKNVENICTVFEDLINELYI